METGIVVDNFDPLYKGRCKIRVFGRHTSKVGESFVILDDDLPWAKPSPSSASNSSFDIPKVGQRVFVEMTDPYNITYQGVVENQSDIKQLLIENAEDCENVKVILFDNNGEGDYIKMYYSPENGLVIDCSGNKITMPKYDNMEIKTKNGVGIEIDNITNNINITTESNINLNAKHVNICGEGGDTIPLGSKLMELFNKHTHFAPGGMTNPPIEKLTINDFSKNVNIK